MEEIRQISNYVVYHEDLGDNIKKFIIKSVSGNWSLSFRNDNHQYQLIESFIYDDDKYEALESALAAWYITTNAILDEEFFLDITNATNSLMERLYGAFDDNEYQDEGGDLFVDEAIEVAHTIQK